MISRLPLTSVRVHLAGSVPEEATPEVADEIRAFVQKLATLVFREGGTIIHGSHPTLREPLKAAAQRYQAAGGRRDSLILVRSQKFTSTAAGRAETEADENYAAVQLIPLMPGNDNETLVPMREWIAERCDVVIAVGGKWYSENPLRAGVPLELEESLRRGKPGFAIGRFGGAIQSYIQDDKSLLSRLRNGLSAEENEKIGNSNTIDQTVSRIIAQIKLLPLLRENVSSGRSFRILALDGGGLRGVFTAAVLSKWADMLGPSGGKDLVKHFDLIAGTSTGAILAIGLALGLPPREMLEFYRREGPKIFPKDRGLRHWLKSKYESQTLRSTLESVFQGRTLSEHSCCRLVIPTVKATHGESEVIVTPHHPDRVAFRAISAVDAALASSAAPTYFDEASFNDAIAVQGYLDGGIWANNPVLPAIAESVRHLGVPLDRIDVLSVGTTGHEVNLTKFLGKGMAGWAPATADLFFAAQEHAATTIADALLSRARHLRVNQATPIEVKLDDVEAIEDLAQRGVSVGKDSFASIRSRFLDGFHAADWRSHVP